MDKKSKNKFKYINDFPIIIMVAVAILIIVLVNVYLSFKPYATVYQTGYMVLSNNMTYNLINNNVVSDDLNVGVASVSNGDSIYKQIDSYYVGLEEKQEIDYEYPIYSTDGLTIYNIKEEVTLVDRNFEKLPGYTGLSINYGILYNDGDSEPADDLDYLFLDLNNSVLINTQIVTIKTLENEYNITVNSPCFFGIKYVNYYLFDGKNFNYQRINDISYDSIITIGNVSLTYEEFLLKMNLVKEGQLIVAEEDNNDSSDNIDVEPPKAEEIVNYVKPNVTVDNFNSNVYSIESKITIKDPSNVITTSPTFEVYNNSTGKLYLRKRFGTTGNIKISGLSAGTEYRIVGTYKYKDKLGNSIVATFHESKITTKDLDTLETLELSSELGERYSNKIEIKNLKALSTDTELISGVRKITINVWERGNGDNKKSINLSYNDMSNILSGKNTTVATSNTLSSNTVYNYQIKVYDKDSNELKVSGDYEGIVQTTKLAPSISYSSDIDKDYNVIKVNIKNKNIDEVYIDDYSYTLFDESGKILETGNLDYTNNYTNELEFRKLDYNASYTIKIMGIYDLEDGKGEQQLQQTIGFITANLSENIIAYYDTKTLSVTYNSIESDIYISSRTKVLEKDDTKVVLYLADSEGNPILDDNGNLKYQQEYLSSEFNASCEVSNSCMSPIGEYRIHNKFENLSSNTEYTLKLKLIVKQIEKERILEKSLLPTIKTNSEDASIFLNSKKLLGDTLDVTFTVIDSDSLIENNKIIVEIYEGVYENIANITSRYIYREVVDLSKTGDTVKVTKTNYTAASYTIVLSANPYKGKQVKKYLNIDSMEDSKSTIIVSENAVATSEIYEQRFSSQNSNIMQTKINIDYNLGDMKEKLYVVDCNITNSGIDKCTELGYIGDDNSANPLTNRFSYEPSTNRITISNNKNDTSVHKFYLAIRRYSEDTYYNRINNQNLAYYYTLTSLDYDIAYEIYNLDNAKDFYDTSLVKTSGETRHYVVTENLDFYIASSRLSSFNGVIDFQGYSVNLYRNNDSIFTLFGSLGSKGYLKNAILNYNLDYDGIITTLPGLVSSNYGTIENFIVNVNQKHATARAYGIGLLSYNNYGTITNFVVYLNSNIDTYYASSLITYSNQAGAIIKNGYVTSNPELNTKYQILLHDSSSAYNGTLAYSNYGTIDSVYNLVDVISVDTGAMIGTIVCDNKRTGIVRNTISVATTSPRTESIVGGPSIYSNTGTARNNYYVDTNTSNYPIYNTTFNKKINLSSLTNVGTLNVILNTQNGFDLTSGYYPVVKMSNFMKGKQSIIPIVYNYFENNLDVISSNTTKEFECTLNELDGQCVEAEAEIEVYINNPYNYEIKSIKIANLSNIIVDQTYNENDQITTVKLKVYLKENDKAKSSYLIDNFSYEDSNQAIRTVQYNDSDKRYVEIDMYRLVDDYSELIKYINSNENIWLTKNVTINKTAQLPQDKTYTSILDGNGNTIDLENYNLARGYFMYEVSGTIKNLNIQNLSISSNKYYLGFIRKLSNAEIYNINIDNSSITIDRTKIKSLSAIYVGTVSAYANNSTITNNSINGLKIMSISSYENPVGSLYSGGIVGYLYGQTISNSYVYNLDVNLDIESLYGYKTIGGIVGYQYYISTSSVILNCYTEGNIQTGYSNIGGIVGTVNYGYVTNNYSAVNIKSSGDFVGGIVGNYISNKITNSVYNNLYTGKLENENSKNYFSVITPTIGVASGNNYSTTPTDPFYTVKATDETNLKEFDKSDVFKQKEPTLDDNGSLIYYYPYLKETSTVDQKIENLVFNSKSKALLDYSITYNTDDSCSINTSLLNYNTEQPITSSLYDNACAQSAVISLEQGYKLELVEEDGVYYNADKTLIIDVNADDTYLLKPNNLYLNNYNVNVIDNSLEERSIDLPVKFYRKIKGIEDWNEISNSKSYENVLLLSDIKIKPDGDLVNTDSTLKSVNNLLGNGYTISLETPTIETGKDSLTNPLIHWLNGYMRDVIFDSITMSGYNANYSSLVSFNNGRIENCKFNKIKILSSADFVAMIGRNSGYIKNIKLNDIDITGSNYVSSLIAYDNIDAAGVSTVSTVYADGLNIKGQTYVGGIIGYSNSPQDLHVSNLIITGYNSLNDSSKYVYPTSYVGGVVGRSDCTNCSIKDSEIYASGKYIGGIGGNSRNSVAFRGLSANNVLISNAFDPTTSRLIGSSSYVGGLYGYTPYITNSNVENVTLGNKIIVELTDGGTEESISNLRADSVGGISGFCYYSRNSSVSDSYITGSSNIGGVIGITTSGYSVENFGNKVSRTAIIASEKNSGGYVGFYRSPTYGTPSIYDNVILNSRIESNTNSGGVIGYLDNRTTYSQNFIFIGNLVEGCEVISNETSDGITGGIIGTIYQIPQTTTIKFNSSLFYGTLKGQSISYGVGKLENSTVSPSEDGYGSIATEFTPIDFSIASGFKEYYGLHEKVDPNYQINSISELDSFINNYNKTSFTTSFTESCLNEEGEEDICYYFPKFKRTTYSQMNKSDYVEIPYNADNELYQTNNLMTSYSLRRNYSLNSYSMAYNNPLNIDYDVYASDVNKVNIEFSNIDTSSYFYYKIGDYQSDYITVDKRTYTITYDYKDALIVYLSNGSNHKTTTFRPSKLAKTVSLIGGETYYLESGKLYSETKNITGDFVNLYNEFVLTNNGKIYNILSKQETDAYIDYSIQSEPKELYKKYHDGKFISTFYNYSIIDNSSIRDYQMIVKNSNISVIDSGLDNKKDSYIIDSYNGNDIQIILNNSGVLYSLKSNIKYPSDLINKNIKEMHTDFNSTGTIVTLKYNNGLVYTFNYINGEKVFTNETLEYSSFIDYVKTKISGKSNYKITSISDYKKYEEIELLKNKIIDISVEDANNQISNNNSSESSDGNYITVYNKLTKNYDVYKLENLLDSLKTDEDIETENEKIYKNYELVQFYNESNKKKNTNSLSGIIIFTISILSILVTLSLLIKRRKKLKVSL